MQCSDSFRDLDSVVNYFSCIWHCILGCNYISDAILPTQLKKGHIWIDHWATQQPDYHQPSHSSTIYCTAQVVLNVSVMHTCSSHSVGHIKLGVDWKIRTALGRFPSIHKHLATAVNKDTPEVMSTYRECEGWWLPSCCNSVVRWTLVVWARSASGDCQLFVFLCFATQLQGSWGKML